MTETIEALLAPFELRTAEVGSFVAGEPVFGMGEPITVEDPATGDPLFTYRDAGADVVGAACRSAAEGFARWQGLKEAERGRVLWRVGQLLRENGENLARLEAVSVGKPIRDARAEALKAAEMFEYFAGWTDKIDGAVIPVPTSHHNHTLKVPYGVVLEIIPWNAPLFVAAWNTAPALAAGNAVVLKPSELTPLSALALALLLLRAGVPPGVVNVLAGYGHTTGAMAIAHPAVRKVAFVGSPPTGRRIAAACAAELKPCVLELGGKSANIVFADADLRHAVGGAAGAIFAAAGQSCVAGSRLLVERPVLGEVTERLRALAGRIVVGPPLDAGTEVGPLQNRRQLERVEGAVAAAKAVGARIVCGGERPGAPLERGFYYPPTMLGGVDNAMGIAREEVFGPVLVVIPFEGEREALAISNDSRYGLAAAVWTQDPARALRMSRELDAGTVWINGYKTIGVMTPFGGFKESGWGRSSGREGLEEYLQTKSVWIETAAEPSFPFGPG